MGNVHTSRATKLESISYLRFSLVHSKYSNSTYNFHSFTLMASS